MGYGVSRQVKYLFHRLSWKRPYPLWLQVPETSLPSIQKIKMFRLKIMWNLSCVFWMQIGKRIRIEQHYGLLYMRMQIQRWVHLRLYQGKTINSEKIREYSEMPRNLPEALINVYKVAWLILTKMEISVE